MSPRNHRVTPNVQTQSRKHIASMSVVVAVVMAVVGIRWYMSPGRWLRQAELVLGSDPAQADALAESAINANRVNLPQAWLIRCRAQLALGKPLEALGAYALIKQPEQCVVSDLCALIEEAEAAHQTMLADMAATAALRHESDRVRVLALALPLKANMLSEPEASELVQELRQLSGSRADCWQAVGITEQVLGQYAEAVDAFRKAVNCSDVTQPVGLSTRRQLAELLIILGQFSEADLLVTEVLHSAPPLSEDKLRLAQLRRSTGDRDMAEQLLDQVIENEPENLLALMLRGISRAEQEQIAKAQADFEHCLRIAPLHDEAHYRLSQMLRRRGDLLGAAKHLKESQRLSEMKRRILEINRRRETALQDPQLMEEMADIYDALGQSSSSSEWRRTAESLRKPQITGQ